MKKTKEEAIQEVLIWFDFDYTLRCMKLKKSFWINRQPEASVQTLKQNCIELMNDAFSRSAGEKYGYTNTGGFEIYCWNDEKDGVDFRVNFIGADWSTGG
jgi:hypothetical protein